MLAQNLPRAIVTSLETLGQTLLALSAAERDGSLANLETGTLAAVRAALPNLLAAVVCESTTSVRPGGAGRRACPTCGKRCRVQSWRPRTLSTICGSLTVERPWYTCTSCHRGWSPADQTWQVGPRTRISAGLAAWLVDLGATTSFADAQRELGLLTGLTVGAETIRQYTERQGMALEEEQTRAQDAVLDPRGVADAVDPAPGTLVVQTDGVMVRDRPTGWHEVKLGAIGSQVEGKLTALSYVAARESPAAFGPRLLAEAARRGALEIVDWEGPLGSPGLARLRPVVVLGDGAHWIWNLAAEHFGACTEIVDFYHAAQHVWTIANALLGEGTRLAARFAAFALSALRDAGADALLEILATITAPSAAIAAVFRVERQYFRTNRTRMDYPTFAAAGLPLGSGAVESAAKHVVELRLKRAGARWSTDGAHAVLMVRCRQLSHRPLAA